MSRFDEIDSRFDDIDSRFDKVDSRFDELEKNTDDRFDKVDSRFDELEKNTDDRFDKVDSRFDELEKNTDDRFDKVDKVLEEQSIELYNVKNILKKHSSQFDEINYTTKMIHNQTVRLSLEQANLNMKIDKITKSDDQKESKNINSI
ncbi:hypothetical protein [Halanaerobium hydrogeniformans]|nr:hypothetical protein [Halanaerobium hydrogeniformans]